MDECGDASGQFDACCWSQRTLQGFLRQHAALSCSIAGAWQSTPTTLAALPAAVAGGGDGANTNTAPTTSTPSAFTSMCATPARWISEQGEVQSAPEYKSYLVDIAKADGGLLYYAAKRTRYLLLVVPRAFRRYITMKVHIALHHLTEKYARLRLLDTCWWPSLRKAKGVSPGVLEARQEAEEGKGKERTPTDADGNAGACRTQRYRGTRNPTAQHPPRRPHHLDDDQPENSRQSVLRPIPII